MFADNRVLTAANGRQGLQRPAEGPSPDLVISDYMMLILNGAEMLRAMRETELQRDIRCIIMMLDARGELAGGHWDYATVPARLHDPAVRTIRDLDAAALQIRRAGGVPWT